MADRKHLYTLNYLRGLAALLVVYAHLIVVASEAKGAIGRVLQTGDSNTILAPEYFDLTGLDYVLYSYFNSTSGELGVFVFFLISGYLIPGLFERYSKSGFLINRVFRLYPTNISSVVIAYVVLYLMSLSIGGDITLHSPQNYICNMLAIQGVCKERPVNGVLWSLQVEIFYYVVLWLYFSMGFKGGVKGILFLMAILTLPVMMYKTLAVFVPIPHLRTFIYIAHFIVYILVGCVVFYVQKNDEDHGLLVISAGFVIYLVNTHKFGGMGFVDNPHYFSTAILAFFIFMSFFLNIFKLKPENKILNFFGDISYPLYLLHLPLGFFLIYTMKHLGWNAWIALALSLIVIFGLSWLIHKRVEMTSHRFGIRLSRKYLN